MPPLVRAAALAASLLIAGRAVQAQAADSTYRCLTPDSIVVRGTSRTSATDALARTGLSLDRKIESYVDVQKALQTLYAGGEYEDGIAATCEITDANKAVLAFSVKERPVLGEIKVTGPKAIEQRLVEDRVDLLLRRAVDPSLVSRAIARIDSLYESSGYVLVQTRAETTTVSPGVIGLTFRVTEGHRMAISGLRVVGNQGVPAADIASAMKTRPEGFPWFRKGEFDPDKYAGDLGERVPALFASLGYLDFHIVRDTVIIDRERGKGLVELTISEGPQYHVGTFSVSGNQHFTDDQLKRYYPFSGDGLSLGQRAVNLVRGRHVDPTVFNAARWEDATRSVSEGYANDGYVYANVDPVIERVRRPDSTYAVNMRWGIDEQNQAIINRIEIVGNDYTTESCIRDMLTVVPGGLFNREQLLQSWQRIGNMGFFETPIEPPETPVVNEHRDLDVIFHVKEKRTGTINFGASTGQGVGIGGFIGLDQPNLFGRCKRGSVNWQFGKYLNDFNLTYTDPSIQLSPYSGTVNLYRSQARYTIADLGQNTRTGGTLRFGMPVRGSNFTRLYLSYTGEAVSFGSSGLLGTVNDCTECFRSAVGVDLARETRIGMPFPFAGTLQSVSAQFNGGPLGGSANFQHYTGEYRTYAPLAQIGGTKAGSNPLWLTLGLSARAGAVFGNTGPFFFSQRFALGGVQFGEPLRGYPEFSITPKGFLTGTSTYNASRDSFGSAFFAATLELGLRFNEHFYTDLFYDAGNVWETPRDFDPTRLFRGSGIGLSTVTPLGPLGLDFAYGFDRLDANGRRDPKWQLHFRLGQLF